MANQGCLGFLFNLFGLGHQHRPVEMPYRIRQEALLTDAELHFYRALRSAVGNAYTICAKVNLADIFETQPHNRSAHNRIDRKHVDFLLCDPQSMRPVAGIELDDSSHQRADRVARDEFVDALFRTGGLLLRRFPVRQSYDPHEIRQSLQQGGGGQVAYERRSPRGGSDEPVRPTPIVGRNPRQ